MAEKSTAIKDAMINVDVEISGETWKVFVLDDEDFNAAFPECAAVTLPDKKHIILNEDSLTRENVRHEYFHACMTELCTDSASLSANQMEEMSAELFGRRGHKMVKEANRIFSMLRRMIRENE